MPSPTSFPTRIHALRIALPACLIALAAPPLAARQAQDMADADARIRSLDCSQLAQMPNPPMSVETCRARQASHLQLMDAAQTPGGERPGDAQMSCTDVIAEMQAAHFAGVSAGTAAESVEAGEQLRETYQASQARGGALAARQTAETMAVATMPNAVQGAVAMRHAAEQKALGAQNTAAMLPARERATQANTTSAMELAASLQANPRFARLMQLVQEKNCQFTDAPSGSAAP